MPRVIITVPEKNPQPYRFQLDRKVVSLGRGGENDIVIDSGSVSGKHAEMHRIEGGYELADLGSTNGIKYDGNRKQVVSLRSGMSLKLGDVTFDFTLTEEELEALGREKPANEPPITKEPPSLPSAPKEDSQTARQTARRSAPRKAPAPLASSSGVGIGMVFLFLLLAACAFYAGLDIRHRKETGEALIKGIVNKAETQKPAADGAPVPDQEEKAE